MQDEQLQKLKDNLVLLRALIDMDLYMAVYDTECTVLYLYPEEGEPDAIRLGEKFEDPTGKLEEAIRTGKEIHNKIPSEKCGFEMEGNVVPVFENGEVTGAVSVTYIPMNQQSLEAQQVALQSMYYLILSVDASNDKCVELYKSYDLNKINVSLVKFSRFVEQTKSMIDPKDRGRYERFTNYDFMRRVLKRKKSISCECRFVLPDGTVRWLEIIISRVGILNDIKHEEKYLFMVHDIHERKRLQEKIDEQNGQLIHELRCANEALFQRDITDEQTGLYNRKGLHHYAPKIFEECLKPGRELFTYMADLNSLKYINDQFGHDAGDRAIEILGRIIKRCAPKDWICARMGGDEYLVIASLPAYSEKAVSFIAKVDKQLKRYNEMANLPYNIEASYGHFFGMVEEENGIERYVNTADQRMLCMKQKQKNERMLLNEQNMESESRTVGFGKDKILIADDDVFMRKVLKSFFDENYMVLEASNGQEALQLIEEEDELGLLLLDLNMPVMDGFQVLEKLRQTAFMKKTPVIMITAAEDVETEETGYELGVSDFVHKPFNATIVRHRVNNILQLYKKQKQLEQLLTEKVNIVETQAKKLVSQAEKLKDH